MSKTYEAAPPEVSKRASALIAKYHPDVRTAGVTIDFVFARNDEEKPAIMHGGYPALGLCRIVSLKDRAKGMSDVEITLDGGKYEDMDPKEQDALLDHELHHIIVERDKAGFSTDDLNRPKIKMRKHDHDFGWFTIIAERHGKHSAEVRQAHRMMASDGQYYWPEIIGGHAPPKDPPNLEIVTSATPAEFAANIRKAKRETNQRAAASR